ncbi:LysR family transcriptional regulator [Caballeronia sordidicola]|uniref:LysR family transcriptional regulator n=1 Tax=Caballeronia sordidicola TaxID=196367 RepID=A0A158EQ28_CABSO|nr:LysR family transcriptional regulator [Caballeronia sordidicola]SAL09655.1 LysR family transcriptional regulator [Caballeronia sordidicola]
MELRHLRCFIAVAEELHFARAAERLHIEQSPLSRAIKELEEELDVQLFVRTTRNTRLTRAGELFREHVPRVFTALQQARDSVKAAANGFNGVLRVALSDGITPPRFSSFLALCRQEEPEIEIRLSEVPLAEQIKGLHHDIYDVGFSRSNEVADGIIAESVWEEPLMVAIPARHPLLTYKRIPLEEVLRYPLVLGDPQACEGCVRQIERVLRQVDQEPLIAERVASIDLMMTLVSAGFALGLAGESQIAFSRELDIVARPLAGQHPMLTTYLLRADRDPSENLTRFIKRVGAVTSSNIRTKPDRVSHAASPEEMKS